MRSAGSVGSTSVYCSGALLYSAIFSNCAETPSLSNAPLK